MVSFFSPHLWDMVGSLFHDMKETYNVNWHFCFWLTWAILLNLVCCFSTPLFYWDFTSLHILYPTFPLCWSLWRFYYIFVLDVFETIWIMLLVIQRTDYNLIICASESVVWLPAQPCGLALPVRLLPFRHPLWMGFEVLLFPIFIKLYVKYGIYHKHTFNVVC